MNFLNWLTNLGLDAKDIIEIFISATGIILSVIAIFYSQKAIKQTEINIYEANRPVISIYLDYVSVYSSVHEYLVIKNFGSTAAHVTSIEFDKHLPMAPRDNNQMFSNNTVPFLLAPNQSFSTSLRLNAFRNESDSTNTYHGEIKVIVKYTDNIKNFEETFILNQNVVENLRTSKSNGTKDTPPTKALLHAVEELIRKNI